VSIISKDINKAIELLQQDELVAIPTETVYGLAGNALKEDVVKKIFELKQRPFFNPLILHVAENDDIQLYAKDVPAIALKLQDMFWPGPLTLLLPKKEIVPSLITAGLPNVALRRPAHPMTIELLKALNFPLAAPSANPFTSISPTSALHVEKYFGNHLKMILDGGECIKGIESTIVGFEDENIIIYRQGSITESELSNAGATILKKLHNDAKPQAPGMLMKHYSPTKKLIYTSNIAQAIKENSNLKLGVLTFNQVHNSPSIVAFQVLSANNSLIEAANKFYAALHHLDNSQADIIIAEKLPESELGMVLNDRLSRASAE
jgi:L-threonylcarbamoyladenylate synthase